MSANTETTGAKCKAPTWCDFDDDEDAGDSRLDVYVKARDGIYGVVSKEGRRYCTPACRDARLPPIAAPAAHVERRKGQRWRLTGPGVSREFMLLGRTDNGTAWLTDDPEPLDEYSDGEPNNVAECCWEDGSGFTMVLLADATPEAVCAKCRAVACVCDVLTVAQAAQEAPKAAPVCHGGCGGMGLLHKGDVLERVIKGRGRILACDGYMLFMGNDGAPIVGTGVLRDPAIAERLPRPQLAADWVEDCLPESGR